MNHCCESGWHDWANIFLPVKAACKSNGLSVYQIFSINSSFFHLAVTLRLSNTNLDHENKSPQQSWTSSCRGSLCQILKEGSFLPNTKKLAREKEQHVFRKVKQGLKHDILQSCLEKRGHAGECWTVESIRFPPWVPLCFYYGKMQLPNLEFNKFQINKLYVTFVYSNYTQKG